MRAALPPPSCRRRGKQVVSTNPMPESSAKPTSQTVRRAGVLRTWGLPSSYAMCERAIAVKTVARRCSARPATPVIREDPALFRSRRSERRDRANAEGPSGFVIPHGSGRLGGPATLTGAAVARLPEAGDEGKCAVGKALPRGADPAAGRRWRPGWSRWPEAITGLEGPGRGRPKSCGATAWSSPREGA